MAKVTIDEVSGSDLHHHYQNQTRPQDVFVELDCEHGTLTCSTNPEIGNAVPVKVWHGHTRRWGIPALKAHIANDLLEAIRPFAERVCEGYESVWDGHNHVAEFTEDAEEAMGEIQDLCDQNQEDGNNTILVWEAAEWFALSGGDYAIARELKITAATTDEDLERIAAKEKEDAESTMECDVLEGTLKFFKGVREYMRDNEA